MDLRPCAGSQRDPQIGASPVFLSSIPRNGLREACLRGLASVAGYRVTRKIAMAEASSSALAAFCCVTRFISDTALLI